MNNLKAKVRKMLKDSLPPDDCPSLLCALSGGKDSCCLLSVMHQLKDDFGYSLFACHINHSIRPKEETEKDIRLCASLCEKYNIPLSVLTVDIPSISKEKRKSIELCAREERYRLLEEERVRQGCRYIVTAHTSTDSAETMLYNILRGAGGDGLCGIPAIRGNILRPLILCTSEEILASCKEEGIVFLDDSTNADTKYTRNYIRLEIFPRLKKINPSPEKNFSTLASALSDDRDYFASILPPFSSERTFLASLHPAILSRVLRKEYHRIGQTELRFDQLKTMREIILSDSIGEKTVCLPDNVIFSVERNTVSFRLQEDLSFSPFPLHWGENPLPGGRMLYLGKDESDCGKSLPMNINKLFIGIRMNKNVPIDKIVVSARKGGEKILIGGMHRPIKKLLQAKKIPFALRASLPFLSLGETTVWVPFLKQADNTLPEKGKACFFLTYYYGG